jgi:hypothetical protein
MVNRVYPRHTALCVAAFLVLAPIASAQQPYEYLLFALPGQTLPPGSGTAPDLLFGSINPSILPSVEQYQQPALFVQKPPAGGQNGIFIADNNPDDHSSSHALNIEVYNQTGTSSDGSTRAAVRVHVDPSVTATDQFVGVGIGNHGTSTFGLWAETEGPTDGTTIQSTQGVGIVSSSWGSSSFFSTEGDETNNSYPTIGMQFNHYSTGSILNMYQAASAMSGDFIFANAGYDFSHPGTFTGNFLNFNVGWSPVFRVDSGGNLGTVGAITGGNLTTNGTLKIPSIRAQTGTRFVCVTTDGTIISQTTPCSGT